VTKPGERPGLSGEPPGLSRRGGTPPLAAEWHTGESAVADEWYYTQQGQQQGPVGPAQLKQLAAAGQLQPTDLVWKEGMANWVPASSTRGLFPAKSAAGPATMTPRPGPETSRRGPIKVEPIDDDDYDEAPVERRPRRRSQGLSTGAWVAIIGGSVGFLVLIGVVILMIVLLSKSGAPSGPRVFTDTVAPGKQTYDITFKGGQLATLSIIGQGNTDVEIYVFDRQGRLLASSIIGFTDRRNVAWMPVQTETFRIELKNNGAFPNRVTITHN
jgi:GYF domain 2